MSKKQQKAQQKKVKTIKELVLLTPSFQFIWEAINEKTSKEDRETRDYRLAKHICNQLAYRIKAYRSIQKETIDLWNSTKTNIVDGQHNPFLAGLSLLAAHMEVKQKNISIGLDSEIVELQELAYEFFTQDAINEAAEWAENIKKELKI